MRIFLSFWTKRFVCVAILKNLIDEYLFSSKPNNLIFLFCWNFWRYRKSIVALYNVVGLFTFDWILSNVSRLIFSTFNVGQEDKSSFNHSGSFHYKVLCFNSLLFILLLGRSVRSSFVLIYLDSTFFLFVISVIRFFTNTDKGFLLFNQFNTHCGSVQIILWVLSKPNSFETNFRIHTPINNAISLSLGIDTAFFGAILVLEKI